MALLAMSPGIRITLDDITVNDVATSPANATITVTFKSDGNIEKTAGVVVTDIGDWLSPQLNMSAYSIRATALSGTVTSGTVGSWLSLGSDRSWNKTRSDNLAGSDVATVTIDIALTADTSIILDTCTLSLTATVIGP